MLSAIPLTDTKTDLVIKLHKLKTSFSGSPGDDVISKLKAETESLDITYRPQLNAINEFSKC